MTKKALLTAVFITVIGSVNAFGYSIELMDNGNPLYWDLVTTDGTHASPGEVILHLNCTTNVAVPNQANCLAWLRASFQAWNNITTSKIDFTEGATTTQTIADNDTINLLSFVVSDPELQGGVIGLTTTWFDTSGKIADTDIRFNASGFDFFNAASSNYEDLQAVATHELGHIVNLDHSFVGFIGDDLLSSHPEIIATMFPYAMTDQMKTLKQDDMSGASVTYPETTLDSTLGTVTGSVTGTTGAAVLGTHVVLLRLTDGASIIAALTAKNGSYVIKGVPPATYVAMCEPPYDKATLGSYYSSAPTSYPPLLYLDHVMASWADSEPSSSVFAAAAADDPVVVTANTTTSSISCQVAYTPSTPLPPRPGGSSSDSGGGGSNCSMNAGQKDVDIFFVIFLLTPIFALRFARKRFRRAPAR